MSIFASVIAFILYRSCHDLELLKIQYFLHRLVEFLQFALAYIILGDKLGLPGWIGLILAIIVNFFITISRLAKIPETGKNGIAARC